MEITIIGWYGTETLGDRAILAGILKLISRSIGEFKVNLGSLYPFFSQRTIDEDRSFWKKILGIDVDVELFDSKNIADLDKAIFRSDFIIMGGGPLMQIEQLFMIRYAFKTAFKIGKKTALIGCGIGPIVSSSYQSCLLDIIENTDLTILRDSTSLNELTKIEKLLGRNLNAKVVTSVDPSAISCLFFKKAYRNRTSQDYIAINLRKFPGNYSKRQISEQVDNKLLQILKIVAKAFANHPIKLIPMHYFHYGNDDRDFLNSIAKKAETNNISVQNQPLSLYQTMEMFNLARVCFGMRLHAVILQTLLNGNNYILDYTEPNRGKMIGFLKEVDPNGFYRKRYINLQTRNTFLDLSTERDEKFKVPIKKLEEKFKVYEKEIKALF